MDKGMLKIGLKIVLVKSLFFILTILVVISSVGMVLDLIFRFAHI